MASSRSPPDGGAAAWSMVGAAFMVMAHTPAVHYIFGLFFVEWIEEFSASRAAIAGVGSISTGIMLGAAYIAGSLQARGNPPGRIVAAGAALSTLGLITTSLASGIWQCYIFFGLIVGFGHALTFPPCPLVVSAWFTTKTNVAVGIATSGSGAGTMYLGIAVAAVIRSSGWRIAFRLLAALTLFAIGGAALVLHVPWERSILGEGCAYKEKLTVGNETERSVAAATRDADVDAESNSFSPQHSMEERKTLPQYFQGQQQDYRLPFCVLFRDRRLFWLCTAYFIISFAWEVPFVHLTAFALDVGLFNTAHENGRAWLLTVGIGAGGLIGRILVTRLADIYGRNRIFIVVLVLMAITNILLPELLRLSPPLLAKVAAIVCAIIIGTGTGTLIALVVPLAKNSLSMRSSTHVMSLRTPYDTELENDNTEEEDDWLPSTALPQASGLVYSMLAVGIVTGPALAGALFDFTGSYDIAFRLCGISFALAVVAAIVLATRAPTRKYSTALPSLRDALEGGIETGEDQEEGRIPVSLGLTTKNSLPHSTSAEMVMQSAHTKKESLATSKGRPKKVLDNPINPQKPKYAEKDTEKQKQHNSFLKPTVSSRKQKLLRAEMRQRWDNDTMHRTLKKPGEAPMAGLSIQFAVEAYQKSKKISPKKSGKNGRSKMVGDVPVISNGNATAFNVRGPNYLKRKISEGNIGPTLSAFSSASKKKIASAPALYDAAGADCFVSEDGIINHIASKMVLPWCLPSDKSSSSEEESTIATAAATSSRDAAISSTRMKPQTRTSPGLLGKELPQYLKDRAGKAVPAYLIFCLSAPIDPTMKQSTLFPSYPISNGSRGQRVVNQVYYFRLTEHAAAAVAQIEADENGEENKTNSEVSEESEGTNRSQKQVIQQTVLPSANNSGTKPNDIGVGDDPSVKETPIRGTLAEEAHAATPVELVAADERTSTKHILGPRRSLPGKEWEVGEHMEPSLHTNSQSENEAAKESEIDAVAAAHVSALSEASLASRLSETAFLGDLMGAAFDLFGTIDDATVSDGVLGQDLEKSDEADEATLICKVRDIGESVEASLDEKASKSPIAENVVGTMRSENTKEKKNIFTPETICPKDPSVQDSAVPLSKLPPTPLVPIKPMSDSFFSLLSAPPAPSPAPANRSPRVPIPGAVRLLHRWCRDCLVDAEVAGQLKFIGRGLNLNETDCPAIAHAYNGTPVLISDYPISEPSSFFGGTSARKKNKKSSPGTLSAAAQAASAAHNASALAASLSFQKSPPNPEGRRYNNLKPGMRPGICEIYRGPNYIEVDLDIAKWYAYVPQRTIAWGLSNMHRLDLDGAFLLEGRDGAELPETLLGCVAVRKLPVTKAPIAAQYFSENQTHL